MRSHGFALPLVLVMLALLTALTLGLSRMVATDRDFLLERQLAWEEEKRIRDATYSLVLYLLTGNYGQSSVVVDAFELPLNGTPVSIADMQVKVQSWSGLYGLAPLGTHKVEAVLRQLFPSALAAKIAAELADWSDEDHKRRFLGYERADYVSEGFAQRPRNAPLRSIDELLELPSVTAAMMRGDAETVGLTDLFLAGGEDNFDLGTAPDVLIGAVLRLNDNQTRDVIEARRRNDWQAVLASIDENHDAFNDHSPFWKGYKYRLDFESNRRVASRVDIELSPYDQDSLFKIIEWQVPRINYE